MHRSGTSAVTGSLALLGLGPGSRLLEPGPDNRKGYFENTDALRLNERALAALGRTWNDYRALPDTWLAHDEVRRLVPTARRILSRLADDGPWVLKDPRLCLLLDLWLEAASTLKPMAVLVVRHPYEVARSLHARDGLPHLLGVLLWLRYVQSAIEGSEAMPRAVVDYARLTQRPVATLDGVARTLGIKWPIRPASIKQELSDFLSSERHHFAAVGQELEDCDAELAARACAIYALLVPQQGQASLAEARDRLVAAQLYVQSSDWGKWLALLQEGLSEASAREVRRRATERYAMGARLRALQAALLDAERHSKSRLAEVHELTSQLRSTQGALQTAEKLSVERLELVGILDARLADTQAALAAAEESSVVRLEQSHVLSAQLAETQQALERSEALSLERLEAVHDLDARLGEVQAALSVAEALSVERLGQVHEIAAQLAETQQALGRIERLSLDRLVELEATDALLGDTQQALERAERLSIERLHQVEQLDARLGAALSRCEEQQAQLGQLRQRAAAAEMDATAWAAELDAIKRSWWWRMLAPVLGLRRKNG